MAQGSRAEAQLRRLLLDDATPLEIRLLVADVHGGPGAAGDEIVGRVLTCTEPRMRLAGIAAMKRKAGDLEATFRPADVDHVIPFLADADPDVRTAAVGFYEAAIDRCYDHDERNRVVDALENLAERDPALAAAARSIVDRASRD